MSDDSDQSFEDEDVSQDEKVSNQKRKGKQLKQHKKSKKQKNQFIDEAAEEDSDKEEEDEIDYETRQRRRKEEEKFYQHRKNKNFMDNIKDIEDEQDIEERYKNLEYDSEDDEDEYYNQNMPDNLRKHKIKVRDDQKVFSVPVRKTKEKEVVICLLNKFAQYNGEKDYSNIYSISYLPSSESLIYIEARSKKDVLYFLDKYQDTNISKVELVNLDDHMGSYIDNENEKYNFEVGMFVKISSKCRNSDYIEDMGQIHELKGTNKVVVKLIPRINLEQMVDDKKDSGKGNSKDSEYVQVEGDNEDSKQKNSFFHRYDKVPQKTVNEIKANRPEQQFYSYSEHGKLFEKYSGGKKGISSMFIQESDHCGYVYLIFNCKDILNYQPRTLDELAKFFPHLDTDQILKENSTYLMKSQTTTNFMVGDSVLINGGQMKGLKGKIMSLTNTTAKVQIKNKKRLSIEEEFEVKDLTKSFEEGQRVKVISGGSQGATGDVICKKSDNDDIYIIFTDNKNTIEIRSKDLAITGKLDNDIEKTVSTGGGDPNDKSTLKKKDLVKLTGFNSVGLVLDISKDFVKILDISGKIQNVSNYSINTRIDTRKFVQRNAEGSNITNNSNVLIKKGQYEGYQCQVIHVFKTYAFLFNPKFRDTYVVENVNNLSLQTTNPVIVRQEPRIAYDMKYGKQENLRPDDMRQYLGKQMRIISGKYKGFQCTVVDIRNEQIKVEINSKFITVFISKTDLIAADRPTQELDAGKTPSYVTQSTYQPNLSTRDHNIGSPTDY